VGADRIENAKLDHVAIGAAHIEDAADLLVRRLGGRPHAGGPGPAFRGAQWEFRDGARVEVIEPFGAPDGFLHRFLASRGPGIHHVTFKVPDIYRAAEAVRARGLTVVGFNDAFEGWKEMFLHPREAQGIVVQLAQTSPLVPDDSWTPDFPFPSVAGPLPDPVHVRGVRLRVRDLGRARAQWEGLLGARGEREDAGQRVVFRWAESPLHVAIEVDERSEEGPIALEVSAASQSERALDGYVDPVTRVRVVVRG
jgi:methylmalonyl-CoA/ethylmalonyl-CoA epimerase